MSLIAWSFLVALGASLVGTLGVRTLARRFNIVSPPRDDRWHKHPTALLGGVAIYAAFLLAWALFTPAAVTGDWLLVACASSMWLLGLVDDFSKLKPYAKLIAQISAATAFTTFGARLPWTENPVINQGLTIFWVVGITNAMNLLDNMDGLSGGVAAIAGGFLTLFFITSDQVPLATLSAAFAGAVLGFLIFNFNPASIFMGDCGSLFIGFCLATMSLISTTNRSRSVLATLGVPVMLLLIPIIDTTLVTVMRKAYRRPVSVGGRDHTSHRLVALGLTERKAVLLLYALSAAGGAMAFLSNRLSTPIAVAILPGFVLAVFVVVTFIARVPVYRPVASADQAQGLALVPTLAEFAYKRRVFEVLFDLATVLLAYYAAFLLHYEGRLPQPEYRYFLESLPVVVVAQITTFLAMGLYRGMWGYATLEDTARIVRSVLLAVAISVGLCWALFGLHRFSRVVHIIDALLLLFAVAGSRISFRLIRDWIVGGRARGKLTLIYGAGAGGELLVRELRANVLFGLDPIGFIDDEPRKVGKDVVGLPVLGTGADLEAVVSDKGISTLVYSTSKIDAARKEAITQRCSKLGVEQRMLKVSLDGP